MVLAPMSVLILLAKINFQIPALNDITQKRKNTQKQTTPFLAKS